MVISGGINTNNSTISGNISKTENLNGGIGFVKDKNFVFTQGTASKVWNIQHNLNKYCSVIIVNSAGDVVIGDIKYVDKNTITVSFSGEFSGKAYCN